MELIIRIGEKIRLTIALNYSYKDIKNDTYKMMIYVL